MSIVFVHKTAKRKVNNLFLTSGITWKIVRKRLTGVIDQKKLRTSILIDESSSLRALLPRALTPFLVAYSVVCLRLQLFVY